MTIEELKQKQQWINWNYKVTKDNKKTKIPISYKGRPTGTSTNYKNTWTTYNNLSNQFSGIGVIFDNGLCGIDIDHKDFDDPIVQDIINLMNTYTELSPSKNGYHILFTIDIAKIPTVINEKGEIKLDNKYYQKNPNNQVECYLNGLTNRFFTFTNDIVINKDIEERTEELLIFLDRYMLRNNNTNPKDYDNSKDIKNDDDIISKIRKSKYKEKFYMLYDLGNIDLFENDNSSADLGLCCLIAKFTKNTYQIDRIFRNSKLYRDKWEREDYRHSTIKKALDTCEYNNFEELEYISARELQEKDIPPIIYYVDELLPQGLNLICSVPKLGKSWLALDLCLSVCEGKKFLNHNTTKCSCLYFALEDSHGRIKKRLNKVLGNEKAPSNLICSINSHDLKNGFVQQIEDFLNKYDDIKLIVIDTLQKVRSEGKNNNAYSHDYKELSMIKRIADERGICIVLIHHVRKGISTDPFERVSGTNGITGTVDTTWVLEKSLRNDEETKLSVVGRDVEYNEYVLSFNKDTCKWQFITTVENQNRHNQEMVYKDNTLAITIKTLVNENNNSYTGTMKSINNKHEELYGDKYTKNENTLRKEVNKIAPMLLMIDKIKFIPAITPKNNQRLQQFIKIS